MKKRIRNIAIIFSSVFTLVIALFFSSEWLFSELNGSYDLENKGASIEKRSKIISPSSLKRTLKNASKTNPNIIMISNPEEFVRNLRLEIGKEAE